jgi:hypothetical protein
MGKRGWVAIGVLTGGVLGAVGRAPVVYFMWLYGGKPLMEETVHFVMLLACAIWFLTGSLASWLAVASKNAWLGAGSGAGLASGASMVTSIPLMCVVYAPMGTHYYSTPYVALLYLAAIALTGAISGGVGGLVAKCGHASGAAADRARPAEISGRPGK